MPSNQFLIQVQQRTHKALTQAIHNSPVSSRLNEAMAYSAVGGKCVRAALVYAAWAACSSSKQAPKELLLDERLDALAAAVEALHAYSLIHDDLPAMDDDDVRRGKPSNHKAYDEATAILTGDALQSLAFEQIATSQFTAQQVVKMMTTLAHAAGAKGMVAGQMLDMAAEDKTISLSALECLHKHKTGALINASIQLGALANPNVSTDQLEALQKFGAAVGLAFQVQDDILDIESDSATLGKPQGADMARNKSTYPALLGLEKSKTLAQQLLSEALDYLAVFGSHNNYWLAYLANLIVARKF